VKITVLKDGKTTDYHFAPEHYLSAYESYKVMQESGEIDAFSIVVA
jgi:hypothetical protein